MNIPLVDLKAQYESIKDEIDEAIARVISNSAFCSGQEVEKFEEAFARYCGVGYAIATDTGTSALYLALRSCGIGAGDEVVTVSHTFVATVEAIVQTGATPVFVDIDKTTYTMDISKLEKALSPKTKAILPVHLYGQPADMNIICFYGEQYRIPIIEDCCQAHGATYKFPSDTVIEKKVGSIGELGCFSFYPSKNLGAYGHGGMITTNNKRKAQWLKSVRNHGQEKRYYHSMVGYNSQMDDMQAAILNVKLKYLDSWNQKRREIARKYNKLLGNSVRGTPVEAPYSGHVYHLYVLRTSSQAYLKGILPTYNIGVGIHYPVPVHLQKGYEFLGYKVHQLPVTEAVCETIISLPMYPELTDEQIGYVVQRILER